jgi:hypothetical protein
MTYVLILFLYAGAFAHTDAVSVTNIPGFKTEQECNAAGQKADSLVEGTLKSSRFVCVEQGNR